MARQQRRKGLQRLRALGIHHLVKRPLMDLQPPDPRRQLQPLGHLIGRFRHHQNHRRPTSLPNPHTDQEHTYPLGIPLTCAFSHEAPIGSAYHPAAGTWTYRMALRGGHPGEWQWLESSQVFR